MTPLEATTNLIVIFLARPPACNGASNGVTLLERSLFSLSKVRLW